MLEGTSGRIARLERALLIALAAMITFLILLNVVTRSLDFAIYWVDELAIYAMIWLVMIGASTAVRTRQGISVNLLKGMVGPLVWSVLLKVVDVIVLAFAVTLIWLSWIWYDPATLASFGFDTRAFSGSTFNYIYDEPTLTIGVPKFLVWLIMPLTAVTMTVHAAANLTSASQSRLES